MAAKNVRRFLFTAAFSMLAALVACGTAIAYPSDLDPSFGGDGRVTTDFAPANDLKDEFARDVAVQPDGKVVVAGEAQGEGHMDVGLARYNPDGSLDGSFGAGGKATADLTGVGEHVSALALQTDGKVVVVGYASGAGSYDDFFVARFGADGALDASFGTGGKVTTNFVAYSYGGGSDDYAYDVAVQPDGKLLVSGGSDGDFALARYNADGSLDASFDGDGMVRTDLGGYSEAARGVAVQPDDKIVAVGGSNYQDFALARYNPDGTLDASFDGDGKLVGYISSGDDAASDVAVDPAGKIVVAGSVNYNAALVRYDPDGTLDPTFGQTGKAINTNESQYAELALQDDGKIVARTSSGDWGLARHRPDGVLDPSLQVSYGWGGNAYPDAYGMALQPDGKALLAGSIENASGFADFALARYAGGSDDAAPQTSIAKKPAAATTDNWADFRYFSTEPRSKFECSLDGAAFGECFGSTESYYRLAEGAHTFEVRATDGAGNTDPTPARWTWKVDRAKPTGRVVIDGGKASTASQKVTLKLAASDPAPGAGVSEMRLQNAGGRWSAWAPYAADKAWRLSPGAGTKTAYAQFRDRAGNVSAPARDAISYRP